MRSLVLVVLMTSATAFACPNLTGTYATCTSSDGESAEMADMTITQLTQNNITVYNVTSTDLASGERNTETLRADGKTITVKETDPDSGVLIQFARTISCNGTKSLILRHRILMNQQEAAQLDITVSKAGNTLKMVTTGHNMGEAVNETITCK